MKSSFERAHPEEQSELFRADPWPHGVHGFRPDARPPEPVVEEPPTPPPDLEAIRREAFEAGREAGRAELPWSDAEQWRAATRGLTESAAVLDALRAGYLREQRELVIDLALAISDAVLGRELVTDRAALVDLVQRAIAELEGEATRGEPTRVLLAPAHHASLAHAFADAEAPLDRLTRIPGVRVEVDPELDAGEARVERGASRVDLLRETLLARVREDLAPLVDVAPEAPPEPAESAPGDGAAEAPPTRAPRKRRRSKPKRARGEAAVATSSDASESVAADTGNDAKGSVKAPENSEDSE